MYKKFSFFLTCLRKASNVNSLTKDSKPHLFPGRFTRRKQKVCIEEEYFTEKNCFIKKYSPNQGT